MAAREGQGLQIAVIIFAMLTILLAITTYLFYAQSQTAKRERDSAVKQRNDDQAATNKQLYQIAAMKFVLGMPNSSRQEVDLQAGKAGEDAEVKELLTRFDADMASLGDAAAPDEAKNYGTLAKILLVQLSRRNASITDANDQTRKAQAERAAVETREKNRADTATASAAKAQDDLSTATKGYTDDRARMTDDAGKIAAQLADKDKQTKAEVDAASEKEKKAQAQLAQAKTTILNKDERIKTLTDNQDTLFENPDGKVTWVNQGLRMVWLNVGRADGLLRQTTFNVYDHDENGVANAVAKGQIEVVQVTGDHFAEARILKDKITNPILPNDLIFTGAWSPGQRIHFAMSGNMDINGDKIDDYDMVRNIVLVNGGIIDAELRPDGTRTGVMSVETRYMILGTIDAEKANPKFIAENTNMENERLRHGVDKISVGEFLSLTGWHAEERTVSLPGNAAGDFRKRTPAKAPAAAPASPATSPAPAPALVDPAAPAAAPVDPFAAPAAAPAVIDPFAPPK